MKDIPKFNLKSVADNPEFFGFGKLDYPISQESVECLYRIAQESPSTSPEIVERVLNLPEERRERLTDLLVKNKGIDIELASNLNLTNEQYGAHRDIAQYNYNVEYGHLKDSGYDSVDKSLISNPDLSLDQLSLIHVATTNNHTYNPQQFLDDNNQVLSTSQILDVMSEQRINANEVKQALNEFGINRNELSRGEFKNLNNLHMNGKTDPEQSKLFYSALNTKLEPIHELDANVEQIAEHKEGQFTSNQNINNLNTQQLANKLEDDFGVKFIETQNNELGYSYYQSEDGSIGITDSSVDVNNLTPEAIELAIAATAAKFGNNIIIDGTDEFKEKVLEEIAKNPNFKDIKILNPELQDQIADIQANYQNNNDLMQAIKSKEPLEKIEQIIKNGADLEHTDNEGQTALILAINQKNPELVKTLLDAGAEVNYNISNNPNSLHFATPLHYAAALHDTVEINQMLIDHGADVTAKDASGSTVLDVAFNNENFVQSEIINQELNKLKTLETNQNNDLIIPKESLENHQAERYSNREDALTSDKHYIANVNGEYITFDNRDELVSAVIEDHNQDYKMDQDFADSYYDDSIDEFAEKLAAREEIENFEIEEIEQVREQEQEYERD